MYAICNISFPLVMPQEWCQQAKKSNSQTLFIQFSLFKSAKQTLNKWQMPKHNELFAVVFGLNTKCYRHEVDARRIKLPKPFKSVTQTCGLQFILQRQKSSDHCGSNASMVLTQLKNPGPSPWNTSAKIHFFPSWPRTVFQIVSYDKHHLPEKDYFLISVF